MDDILWVGSHDPKDYELYYKIGNNNDLFDTPNNLDNHSFTKSSLRHNLILMRQLIELDRGRIFYNEGIAKDPEEHFKTKHPIIIRTRTFEPTRELNSTRY